MSRVAVRLPYFLSSLFVKARWTGTSRPWLLLVAVPLLFALLEICGPFKVDPMYRRSGLGVDVRTKFLPGVPTIDPNDGVTSYALGKRAATDILEGRLPLWNHYEGLGTPLLGEMQSAALFPPTLLLALPGGQSLERALLQIIAGFGAFLFFRKFGLGVRAAFVGGILFELNGVYAWLHNAIFNPVAFLPWLFLAIEHAHFNVGQVRRFADRVPALCLGAGAGALALYAGFPEQVYLYSLLLFCWAVFRTVNFSWHQRGIFIGDLVMMASLCLLLSAPALVAFGSFLTQAMAGAHDGNAFYGAWPPSGTVLQYFLPYVYGPIFGLMDPPAGETLAFIWGNIGGYCGIASMIAACVALMSPERRALKIFLLAWIVIAFGASHGWPGIYQAFMALPLTKIAACFRYLGISWIFCMIFLAVLFVDETARRRSEVGHLVMGAALASLGVMAFAIFDARKLITLFWGGGPDNRLAMAIAVSAALVISATMLRGMWSKSAERASFILATTLVAEAALWFLVPYLSYPRRGDIDKGVIAFLQNNVGHQRVVGTPAQRIVPNFGSALGIPLLNYDDVPVPRQTVAYIQRHLDPLASHVFIPGLPPLPPAEDMERKKAFHERLSAYAHAGVKYVLAGGDFNADAVFAFEGAERRALTLMTGDKMIVSQVWNKATDGRVAGVSLSVGTFGDTATGNLIVRFCAEARCAEGTVDLAQTHEAQALLIRFEQPISIKQGIPFSIQIEKASGATNVAIWMRPSAEADLHVVVAAHSPALPGFAPDVGLIPHPDLLPAYVGAVMSVYELADYRPYISAPGCGIEVQS